MFRDSAHCKESDTFEREWSKLRFKSIKRFDKPTRRLTSVKSTKNLVMSPSILPRETCSGPSTSKAGIR